MNGDDRNDDLETRVSDALGAYASTVEPSPDALDRIRDGRPNPFTRRAPMMAAAAALVVVVAIGAGVALSSDDDPIDVGVDPPAESTPSTEATTTTTTEAPTTTLPPTTVAPTAPPTTIATNPSIFEDGVMATTFEPLDSPQWRELVYDAIGGGAASPQAAGEAIAARSIADVMGDVPVETRVNVARQSATEAVVEITYRRWPDDSVRGVDQRLTLMFGEIGWVVNAAESRSLCDRGIDTNLNLCV